MTEQVNQQTDNRSTSVEESFDTTGFILDYIANWKWVVASVIAFCVGAVFYIYTVVPTYNVSSSVYLNGDGAQAATDAISFADNPFFSMKGQMDEDEMEILRSRDLALQVVDSLKMNYQYWAEGTLRDRPLYQEEAVSAVVDSVSLYNMTAPIYIKISQGKTSSTYNVEAKTKLNRVKDEKEFKEVSLPFEIELSQGTVTLSRNTHVAEFDYAEKIVVVNPRSAAKSLSENLLIDYAQKHSTVLNISCPTQLPRQGFDVLHSLIHFYNAQIIDDKNLSAVQTEAFILERLVMINDELRDVEQRLQEYRQRHNISDLTAQVHSNFQTQQTTQGQLADIEAQEVVISSIEATIAQADAYTPLPSATMDTGLNQIIESYNKRVAQLNRLLETSTPDNPLVRTLKEELQRDKTRILQSVASVKQGLQARRSNITALENRSESQLSALPPIDKGLQEIFREQQVKVNIYTFLLEKREEIALQKTLATPTARFINSPATDEKPLRPRKLIILFVAFVFGLLTPAGLIYLRRLIFPIFRDQEELQRLTDVPIIGEISKDNGKHESPIVIGENVATPIAELFRLLRNNIRFTKNGLGNKVILLTSAIPGEGKTFVSSNLAMTYALTGKKVVVVGLDIRRPVLASQMGIVNNKGVTTFLSGQVENINSLVQKSQYNDNLYVLPAGPIPPNPNELLMSDNMSKMMEQLRADFDYIIVDSAPIGVISDTLLIVAHTDIQLFVTRASFSTKSGLKVLHQAIADNRLSNPYVVLNGVDISSGGYRYRKYGHYSTQAANYGY